MKFFAIAHLCITKPMLCTTLPLLNKSVQFLTIAALYSSWLCLCFSRPYTSLLCLYLAFHCFAFFFVAVPLLHSSRRSGTKQYHSITLFNSSATCMVAYRWKIFVSDDLSVPDFARGLSIDIADFIHFHFCLSMTCFNFPYL